VSETRTRSCRGPLELFSRLRIRVAFPYRRGVVIQRTHHPVAVNERLETIFGDAVRGWEEVIKPGFFLRIAQIDEFEFFVHNALLLSELKIRILAPRS
jgi:hypothetical protein